MSTPGFAELDEALFALPSAGDTAGLGSAFDLGHIHLDTDVNAFSPSAPTDTVSPKDVMFDASSVPPSATFTDLSTPLLESPGAFSSGPSPMFTDLDLLGPNDWTPLFDDAAAMDAFQGLAMVASIEEPSKTGMPQPVQTSKPASPVKSVSSPISAAGSTKPSSVAGINRPRKELSPIAFDPSDPVAAKRARNTEAARKSRAKKLERQMSAEARIADLQKQLADRDAIIANLQAQLEAQRQFA
ncbi:Cross-pathway control protein A [Penicillium ucsense]|uniref:Cross-pathway control protein A n=1 Tax=Penicillium ucsense TaxID=2839758 RepID=A0A8J8WI40_9EURO|nr:Cross-pathway control protein A [Penicillium ucsense]KAF7738366.1 Cross-pathway control protein A [Penicillium ucsense]